MGFTDYAQVTLVSADTGTEDATISAGDSTLVFAFSFVPPEGETRSIINAGYLITAADYEDETFFVATQEYVHHSGASYVLYLRRCGPIPKRDYTVTVVATMAATADPA